MANQQIFNNTLIITGSVTASEGFYGDGSNVTGVVSSSYATTSSYAHFAVSASHEITFEVSSSHALRADQADSVAFEDITDKPTIISSSLQFDDLTSPFTGSFTGSFVGDGTNLTGLAAGNDTEVQLNNNGELGASSNLTYDGTALNIGNKATIGSSHTNNGDLSTIAGGHNNTVEDNTYAALIGGGCDNSIESNSNFSIILGGICNIVGGPNTTILGGLSNQATSNYSFIGSGYGNCIGGSINAYNAIVSGRDNTITASCAPSLDVNFIGGGKDNTICESSFSSILGGVNNTVEHDNSFIIGSNLTTTAACTTYINNLTVSEKVGIGETDPDSILHLKGDTPEIKVESTVTLPNTLSSKIGFYGGNDTNIELASIRATEYSSDGIGGKFSIFTTTDPSTPTERISIDSSGNIDLTGELRMDGDVDVTGGITVNAGSNTTQALEATGSINITGSLELSGSLNISGSLVVDGPVILNGLVEITQDNFDLYLAAAPGTLFTTEQGYVVIK